MKCRQTNVDNYTIRNMTVYNIIIGTSEKISMVKISWMCIIRVMMENGEGRVVNVKMKQ